MTKNTIKAHRQSGRYALRKDGYEEEYFLANKPIGIVTAIISR